MVGASWLLLLFPSRPIRGPNKAARRAKPASSKANKLIRVDRPESSPSSSYPPPPYPPPPDLAVPNLELMSFRPDITLCKVDDSMPGLLDLAFLVYACLALLLLAVSLHRALPIDANTTMANRHSNNIECFV